jgi:putative cell wall-binding protein
MRLIPARQPEREIPGSERRKGFRMTAVLVVTTLAAAFVPATAVAASANEVPPPPIATMATGADTVSPADLLGLPPRSAEAQTSSPNLRSTGSPQSDHTIDIAVVAPSGTGGSTSFIDDTSVRTLVSEVGAYWNEQSDAQILTLTPNATIDRYPSSHTCSEQNAIWQEAAAAFGHADLNYYVASPLSRHLLVFVPAGCGPLGFGSVGSYDAPVSTGNGGVIWISMSGATNLDVVAHEFGHNLGLEHSNTHFCPDPSVTEGLYNSDTGGFSDGCADVPYEDAYDLMGAAYSVNYGGTIIANTRPTALNATHKDRLGVVGAGEMQSVALDPSAQYSDTAYTLATTGASSGLRSLKVTDPFSGQVYFIDFRGGGGIEAGALYATGYLHQPYGVDLGVRITTRRADGTSVVLLTPDSSTNTGRKLYLTPGQSLTTRSTGLVVNVRSMSSGGSATIDVALGTVPGTVSRLSGPDRFTTSAAISTQSFDPGVPTVFIANGFNFPDALSAGPVGGKTGSPVLLVTPGSIPDAVQTELTRLNPANIIVLGGVDSVQDSVALQLGNFTSGTVTRLSGADRFETSAAISAASFDPGVGTAYIANGFNFPDALSAGPVGGMNGAPVLLVTPGSIPDVIQKELTRLNPRNIVVLGGANSVTADVAQALQNFTAGTVGRLSGADRFMTSAAISTANFAPGIATVYIANGFNFPDALSAGPVGGMLGVPVLLVTPDSIPDAIQTELTRIHPARIVVLGGTNSVSASVARQLAAYTR